MKRLLTLDCCPRFPCIRLAQRAYAFHACSVAWLAFAITAQVVLQTWVGRSAYGIATSIDEDSTEGWCTSSGLKFGGRY